MSWYFFSQVFLFVFFQNNIFLDFRWFFLKLDLFWSVCVKSCKYCEAALSLSTDQNYWSILSQNVSNVIEMTQCYFLIMRVNNNIANQMRIIHYKLTCLSKILECCKSDQILESHYQEQKNVLRQRKYKYEQ